MEFFTCLRKMNQDKKARLHLDTNATVLTRDFVDRLIDAGVTWDTDLARKYFENSWDVVKYIIDNYYPERVFIGIGIPYNKAFYPDLEELAKFGEAIARMDSEVQVCVLDYRPEFRAHNIERPTINEMLKVKKILSDVGLKTVIVQTYMGHIGP